MKASRALVVCLLTSCSSPGEAKELVEWSERSAEAYCRCTTASDPGTCADEIPQDLLLSSDNFADLIARFRGRGGERSTAELKRARECEQTLIAWRLARTGASPSAVPSTSGSASNVAPTLSPSASTSSVASPSASSIPSPPPKNSSENNGNPKRL